MVRAKRSRVLNPEPPRENTAERHLMFVEDTLSPEEIEAARKAWKKLRERKAAEKAAQQKAAQFSIVDPPLRDEVASRTAKRKEKLS